MEQLQVDTAGITPATAGSNVKYPAHPSIPVGSGDGPLRPVTEEDQLSSSYGHRLPQRDGIHALELRSKTRSLKDPRWITEITARQGKRAIAGKLNSIVKRLYRWRWMSQ